MSREKGNETLRNQFHGVSTYVSEASNFDVEPRLFSDTLLNRDDWTGAKAPAHDTIDGTNGPDEVFGDATGLSANDAHRHHGDNVVAGSAAMP